MKNAEMNWERLTGTIEPGDKIGRKPWTKEAYFLIDEDGNIVFDRALLADQFLKDDWQVIRPEPKVLTSDEYVEWKDENRESHGKLPLSGESYASTVKDFEAGHKNGRLERDFELRPLIQAVRDLYLIADHDGVSTYTQKVFNEFSNLPQLT